jgi:hypothetical protein
MSQSRNANRVKLDLNNEEFQKQLAGLDKTERNRVRATCEKLVQLTWNQVYRDHGLKWEQITSIAPPPGVDAFYSLRITRARRAIAYRDGDFIRFLTIERDHDATYGKK